MTGWSIYPIEVGGYWDNVFQRFIENVLTSFLSEGMMGLGGIALACELNGLDHSGRAQAHACSRGCAVR
jgi:hypothetical protein